MSRSATLYVQRKVLNADDLINWFKGQGVESVSAPGDMHVTIAFSRAKVDWDLTQPDQRTITIRASADRDFHALGDKGAKVLRIVSGELEGRWQHYRDRGASWDYEGYKPHVTITYGDAPDGVVPYFGDIVLGPEILQELEEGWRPVEKRMSGKVIELPALIKGRMDGGKRIVEVEASVELEDEEGDLILQKALLDSADSFIRNGHLDIDHLSELGEEAGIPNPLSWIIGRPLEVQDAGGGRTIVKGEIKKALDGHSNPDRNKYDEFWDSLMSDPPTPWRASVYGFMGDDTIDCREMPCPGGPARFLVRSFDWRSLAFTRNPVNQGIKGYAKIVTAKSWMANRKMAGWVTNSSSPSGLKEHVGRTDCPTCGGLRDRPSMVLLERHYKKCCGFDDDTSNVLACAAMYQHLQEKALGDIHSGETYPTLHLDGHLSDASPNKY